MIFRPFLDQSMVRFIDDILIHESHRRTIWGIYR